MKVTIHLTESSHKMQINALRYEVLPSVVKVVEELEGSSGLVASLNRTKTYVFSLANISYLEVDEND